MPNQKTQIKNTPQKHIEYELLCASCGYNLKHQKADGQCTECGLPIAKSIHAEQEPLRAVKHGVQVWQGLVMLIVLTLLMWLLHTPEAITSSHEWLSRNHSWRYHSPVSAEHTRLDQLARHWGVGLWAFGVPVIYTMIAHKINGVAGYAVRKRVFRTFIITMSALWIINGVRFFFEAKIGWMTRNWLSAAEYSQCVRLVDSITYTVSSLSILFLFWWIRWLSNLKHTFGQRLLTSAGMTFAVAHFLQILTPQLMQHCLPVRQIIGEEQFLTFYVLDYLAMSGACVFLIIASVILMRHIRKEIYWNPALPCCKNV